MSTPLESKYARYRPENVNLATVALKACAMGVVLLVSGGIVLMHNVGRLQCGVTIMRVAVYCGVMALFHMLEFMSTCLFNNSQTDDDSFILNDSELHLVFVASIVDAMVENRVWDWGTTYGLVLVLLGQLCRTGAMYTARESFNHYIQRQKNESHVLVTTGIYRYLRHPSYFGFFWWFIGIQLYLGNAVVLLGGGYKLWKFFRGRIGYEEQLLVRFFPEYDAYRRRTFVGIPFIG